MTGALTHEMLSINLHMFSDTQADIIDMYHVEKEKK